MKLIWSLPVAGLFYVAGVLLRGEFANPAAGAPAEFAARAGRAAFPISYLLIIIASGLTLLGYVALRDRLAHRLAPAAMVLSIVGLHFLTAFFGVMALTYPAFAAAQLAGDSGAVAIAAHALASPITMAVMGMVGLNVIGHVLFAVAMWPSLPRPAIVLFVLAPIMQMVPWIYPVEILGCVFVLVSGAWIARMIGR